MHGLVVHDHSHQLRDDDQLRADQRQQIPQLRSAHHDGHTRERLVLARFIEIQKKDAINRIFHCWWSFLHLTTFSAKRLVLLSKLIYWLTLDLGLNDIFLKSHKNDIIRTKI